MSRQKKNPLKIPCWKFATFLHRILNCSFLKKSIFRVNCLLKMFIFLRHLWKELAESDIWYNTFPIILESVHYNLVQIQSNRLVYIKQNLILKVLGIFCDFDAPFSVIWSVIFTKIKIWFSFNGSICYFKL